MQTHIAVQSQFAGQSLIGQPRLEALFLGRPRLVVQPRLAVQPLFVGQPRLAA
jgi:hypothetical protein